MLTCKITGAPPSCPAASGSGSCFSLTRCSRADLGIAPRRVVAGTRATVRRRLGASGALVGCGAAGRAVAWSGGRRLGNATGKRSTGGATRTILERACRRVFVGCTQDRRACRPTGAIMGRAFSFAGRPACLVSTCSGGAAATCSRLGAATCRAGACRAAFGSGSWFDNLGRASRRRRNSARGGGTCRAGAARRCPASAVGGHCRGGGIQPGAARPRSAGA